MKQECPPSLLLFEIVLEVLAITIKQEKNIKRIIVRKKEVKLPLFVDNMILYLKDSVLENSWT